MRVFISASYSSEVNDDGRVNEDYRRQMEIIIGLIESFGHQVFFAPRSDSWVSRSNSPAEALSLDLSELDCADLVIALVEANPPSAGVQFEIGYAQARGRRIIILRREADALPFMNKGLVALKLAEEIAYQDIDDMDAKLRAMLARKARRR